MKPSDLKNNKRVVIPDTNDDAEEIRRKNLKSELRKVVRKYKEEHCDKFGNLLENNLSKTKMKDMKKQKTKQLDQTSDPLWEP